VAEAEVVVKIITQTVALLEVVAEAEAAEEDLVQVQVPAENQEQQTPEAVAAEAVNVLNKVVTVVQV
tara:strand:- start:152 stop:352 length:201 start_codon:yes stop_codon:yes gene_type:complete